MLYATDLLIVAWIFRSDRRRSVCLHAKLISVLSNQPQLLMQAAAPSTERTAHGKHPQLFSVTSSLSLALMLASGAVFVVVLGVNRAFVSWWVGANQYLSAALTTLLHRRCWFGIGIRRWCIPFCLRPRTPAVVDGGGRRRGHPRGLPDSRTRDWRGRCPSRVFLAGALLVSIPANLTLWRVKRVSHRGNSSPFSGPGLYGSRCCSIYRSGKPGRAA